MKSMQRSEAEDVWIDTYHWMRRSQTLSNAMHSVFIGGVELRIGFLEWRISENLSLCLILPRFCCTILHEEISIVFDGADTCRRK